MDRRNYQFGRKNLRRVDETQAEFDLLIQRTTQRITIGERPSYKTGKDVHWYRIGNAEVPIDAITEFEAEEDESESDTV